MEEGAKDWGEGILRVPAFWVSIKAYLSEVLRMAILDEVPSRKKSYTTPAELSPCSSNSRKILSRSSCALVVHV
jgi:hypothetical protein